MTKIAPRPRSRVTMVGLVFLFVLALGQLGVLSARADVPTDPLPATNLVDNGAVAPAIDEGSPEQAPTPLDPGTAPSTTDPVGTNEPPEAIDPDAVSKVDAVPASDDAEQLPEPATASTTTTSPDLRVTKASNAVGVQHRGDRFAYTITVTNAGSEGATGVRIHDELPDGLDVLVPPLPSFQGTFCTVASSVVPPGIPFTTVDCGPVPLAGGASATIEIDVRVNGDTCGAITNRVDVGGSNEPPGNVGADNHAEATDELACVPRIRLATSGPSLAHLGDRVRYTFSVTNTGAVDLDGVGIDDPLCDQAPKRTSHGNGDAILSPGERWSFSCPHAITAVDGDVVHNTATVRASSEGRNVTDTDAQDVRVIHPNIAIVTTATPTSGAAGTSISYTFAVTNTGDTGLRDVSVDDVHGHVGTIASLAPGHTVDLTTAGRVGTSPVTNVATAAGKDALGRSVQATDAVTVTVVSAGGAGGTPFTGADTGRLTAVIALLTLSGLGSILVTGRRHRTA